MSPKLAIAGDAAHVTTPMTGAGLRTGLDDVVALSEELTTARPDEIPDALRSYERRRLPAARSLVSYGLAWRMSSSERRRRPLKSDPIRGSRQVLDSEGRYVSPGDVATAESCRDRLR